MRTGHPPTKGANPLLFFPLGDGRRLCRFASNGADRARTDDLSGTGRGHSPFQALRIFVNDELGELDRGLAAAERMLVAGGRLAVVTFHSLEDRRVKRFLAARAGRAPRASRHAPPQAASEQAPSFRLIARRAARPSEAEAAANPRSRSARLRAAVRLDAPAWEDAA